MVSAVQRHLQVGPNRFACGACSKLRNGNHTRVPCEHPPQWGRLAHEKANWYPTLPSSHRLLHSYLWAKLDVNDVTQSIDVYVGIAVRIIRNIWLPTSREFSLSWHNRSCC